MKKVSLVMAICLSIFVWCSCGSVSRASDEIDIPQQTPDVVIFQVLETPAPEITPTPKVVREVDVRSVPVLDYEASSGRCLSRAIWTVVPVGATWITKVAFAEIPQNMVEDGRYKDTIRYTLLMETEFPSYDPDGYRSDENNEIADLVMRSWEYRKQNGSDEYRYVPASGVRYEWVKEGNKVYIVVYDFDWTVVFDSREYK